MMTANTKEKNTLTYRDFLDTIQETGGNWLSSFKKKSHERFSAIGFPTKKNEDWKYIGLDPILNFPIAESKSAVKDVSLKSYFLDGKDHNRVVFVNGNYSDSLSQTSKGNSFTLERLNSAVSNPALKTYLDKDLEQETNPFALINGFRFQDGVYVHIPKNESPKEPIHLILSQLPGDARPTDLRIVVVLEENSSAEIVFDHLGLSEHAYFENVVTEIHLGKGARLEWLNLTRESKNGFHFHTIRAFQSENSRLDALFFSQGGAITRNETLTRFQGKNASCDLKGLSLLDNASQIYNLVTVDHTVGHCTSRQLFKNILAGKTKSEINSLVHMHPDAQKSDSHQLIRNLLLSRDAQAYSRPQLKIHADDVKATHGATTGQLSKQELFYLKSRGLNEKQARFMLTYGFAEEVVEQIAFPSIRSQIEAMVEKEIKEIVD